MTPEDIERLAREVIEGHFQLMLDGEYEARRPARPDWQRAEAVVAAALRHAYNAGVEDVALSFDKSWPRCAGWARALKLPE